MKILTVSASWELGQNSLEYVRSKYYGTVFQIRLLTVDIGRIKSTVSYRIPEFLQFFDYLYRMRQKRGEGVYIAHISAFCPKCG